MQTYDLIVVGAGPAGLLAALAARRAGLLVALLERKPSIDTLDRLCGQTLVSVNDYYFNDLVYYNNSTRSIGFVKSGISIPYTGPVQPCYAWHIYSPDGVRVAFGMPEKTRPLGSNGAVGIAIDKAALFASLREHAQALGVAIFTGMDVTEVITDASSVTVTASETTFTGAYLIAADGTNSRIARVCGFNTDRTFYCYLLSSGGYFRGLRLPEPDILISSIAYTKPAPGFMFIFPRPHHNEHTVAFLTLDPRTDLAAVARYFMQDNPLFAGWFKEASMLRSLASSQHILSPVINPYRNRVLLAGDAGSCQELENTGAMLSGWKAGCAVAAAVYEQHKGIAEQAIADYIRWWQEIYIKACPHETYMMNFVLPYIVDTEADLDYLFSIIESPLPPCWNPYAAIAHLGSRLHHIMPRIAAERPALAQKLGRMSLPLSEIIRETTKACGQDVMATGHGKK
ncbi:MAG: FAD-dependent monooxygenase [Desulfobacterota bacterium]|nr:FAD-dependent monooxygenase [Thermodesulfobacteriota bacterium]